MSREPETALRHLTTHPLPATGLRWVADTSWHLRGACHVMDPEEADELFFPLPRDVCAIVEAKSLCARCAVRLAAACAERGRVTAGAALAGCCRGCGGCRPGPGWCAGGFRRPARSRWG
ncbi:WhiB family transcriptional regulator [Streptomyces sp. NPDC006645]|uniref:WhiB family transcriptional regulator n=1 Tax=unclassified Streptomyces TaxID=2593676 RepID=UPI0033BD1E28